MASRKTYQALAEVERRVCTADQPDDQICCVTDN
jgi:hypothetical protein